MNSREDKYAKFVSWFIVLCFTLSILAAITWLVVELHITFIKVLCVVVGCAILYLKLKIKTLKK